MVPHEKYVYFYCHFTVQDFLWGKFLDPPTPPLKKIMVHPLQLVLVTAKKVDQPSQPRNKLEDRNNPQIKLNKLWTEHSFKY